MRRVNEMILAFSLIGLGVAAGLDEVLSVGGAEAWAELLEGRIKMLISGICLYAGISIVVAFTLTDFLADRRRSRARKIYGERYR